MSDDCPLAMAGGQYNVERRVLRPMKLFWALVLSAIFLLWTAVGVAQVDCEQMKLKKERALGEGLAKDAERESTMVRDSALIDYVSRIAKHLSEQCAAKAPIDIRLIASSEANGFALPAGFVFVKTGLIRDASTEAEFAGVLAHLITRVEVERSIRQSWSALVSNDGCQSPLIYMGGWTSSSYRENASLFPLGAAAQSRMAATMADARGARCVADAGYDPREFIRSLSKLGPKAAERVSQARSLLDSLAPRPESVVSTSEFDEAKLAVSKIRASAQAVPSLHRAPR